ncbi:MAG: flavodoxin family protein [Peptococcaceae bacterium]|nr:flavodoxin family protein [Peptococcaceae bacterium]
MKVLAINGSHRKGKNTAEMLRLVLEEVSAAGGKTELLEITDYRISPCRSCNRCLRKPECSITDDDMGTIAAKMLAADGIVLGCPTYFANVTGLMKIFMDRTRWMHMCRNMLQGKVGAALTHAGLRNGGQETALAILERFLWNHGLEVVDSRNQEGGLFSLGAIGSMFGGLDGDTILWKKGVAEDTLAVHECRQLGRNLVERIRAKK